ncbi:MAG: glycosyltransferase family 2 protein [Cyclobacteriaceae bacterium]|nr:glycosyltransferase family 2 protein [Cyclobacteriaceae bacterium SS2]
MQGKQLAVVIPFYEGHEQIQACIKSVTGSNGWDSSDLVIVVDNSPHRFENINPEQVKVIVTQPGLGFGKANNLGYEYARDHGFELVCILNQDAVLDVNALISLTEALAVNSGYEMVAPFLYRYDFMSIEAFFIQHYLVQNESLVFDMIHSRSKKIYEMEHLSGACLMTKVETLNKTGFFDPVYHMYEEDQDLSRRFRKIGFKLGLVTAAKLGHLHSNTDEELSLYVLKQRSRSAFIYECKDISRGFIHNITIGIRKQLVLMTMLLLDLKIKSLIIVWSSLLRNLFRLHVYFRSYKAERIVIAKCKSK